MLLQRTFISYLAHELARRLGKQSCDFADLRAVQDAFEEVIIDELSLEDEINAEVRELLNQYTDYMRKERIPYQEMFRTVKRNLLTERKVTSAQPRGGDQERMKISRDKTNELSHKLAAKLPRIPGVRRNKAWNEVRLEILREIKDLLMKEAAIDKLAQTKITNQQRDIPEGGEEWKVLHRRYYEEEMKRYGIDLSPQAPQFR